MKTNLFYKKLKLKLKFIILNIIEMFIDRVEVNDL